MWAWLRGRPDAAPPMAMDALPADPDPTDELKRIIGAEPPGRATRFRRPKRVIGRSRL